MRAIVLVCLLSSAVAAAAPSRVPLVDGRLASGVHRATLKDLVVQFGQGPDRVRLLRTLRTTLVRLRKAGVQKVYLGGSFVSGKPTPADVDLLVDEAGEPSWPHVVQAAQQVYGRGLEVFPAHATVDDALAVPLTEPARQAFGRRAPTFLEFFQQNRDGAVGVVELSLIEPIARVSRPSPQGESP